MADAQFEIIRREECMGTISHTLDGRLTSCHDLPPKGTIFGQSEAMRGLSQIVERVAGANVPLIILGEKGTGKETLARFIHSCSPGPNAPFLKLSPRLPDGPAIDEVAVHLEPEATGEQGCIRDGAGPDCRSCTLFVEEISELSPDHQLELLQLIKGSRPFISTEGVDFPVAFRVIGTSSQDLEREVAAGNLREDLFSLLSVVALRLSPLRERKEDIPELANYFWQLYSKRYCCQLLAPSPRLILHLQEHDWPGNIRELENIMKRYVVLGSEGIKGIGHPEQHQAQVARFMSTRPSVSLKQVTREAAHALERKIILRTLQETQWNRRRTARALNISYRALLYKIKEAGLLPEQPGDAVEASGSHSQKSRQEVA
jgi:two-component system, NtrC family, response regulator AtoC